MEQPKRIVNDKWIKASVLAGLWAGVEIIAGSFLHNLRIPFSGTFLTFIFIKIPRITMSGIHQLPMAQKKSVNPFRKGSIF